MSTHLIPEYDISDGVDSARPTMRKSHSDQNTFLKSEQRQQTNNKTSQIENAWIGFAQLVFVMHLCYLFGRSKVRKASFEEIVLLWYILKPQNEEFVAFWVQFTHSWAGVCITHTQTHTNSYVALPVCKWAWNIEHVVILMNKSSSLNQKWVISHQ